MPNEEQSSLPTTTDTLKQKYILLEDYPGSVSQKNLFYNGLGRLTRSNTFNALRGGLYQSSPVETEDNSNTINLASVENNTHYVHECSLKDVHLLTEKECNILLAIPSCQERYDAVILEGGKSKLKVALEAQKDDIVEVYDEKGDGKIGIGFLKSIGPEDTKKGTYFHVVLQETVGVVSGMLQSEKHETMAVPLNRIKFLSKDLKENKRSKTEINVTVGNTHQKQKLKDENSVHRDADVAKKRRDQTQNPNINTAQKPPSNSATKKTSKTKAHDAIHITTGSRVVYFPDKADAIHGTVRFAGNVKDDGVLVGVELDKYSPKYVLGNYYKGRSKLFECEHGKGLIVRPHELLREEEYLPCTTNGKKTDVNANGNNLGATGVERKEAKRSEVNNIDIIKQQEELFRKIKEEKDLQKKDLQNKERTKNDAGAKTPLFATDETSKRNTEGHNSITSNDPKVLSKEQLSLELGDLVEIKIKSKLYYGVLKWKGKHEKTPDLMAGVELESGGINGCTNGTFVGKKYFHSPLGRAFFTKLHSCMPDSRFTAKGTAADKGEQQICKKTEKEGYLLPNVKLDMHNIGRKKGIQGHYNSCYMDSTLFSMFAYSQVFDVVLNRKKRKFDTEHYDVIKGILKEQIVNPLRRHGYVDYHSIYELRKYLSKFTNTVGFMDQEKDPEELIVLLFEKVLKVEPYIKLHVRGAHGKVQSSYLYPIVSPNEVHNPVPSIQYLLETSFLDRNLQLAEVPSVMILKIPRFGQEKINLRVQLTSELDITPLLVNVCQKCVICGQIASIHCQECACEFGGWEVVHAYFCTNCCHTVHKHPKRLKHQQHELPKLMDSISTANHVLELFAVVCTGKNHYVSFVKCGEGENENWVFFDSVADTVGGQNGHNVSQVTEISTLKHFLNGSPLKISELDDKDSGHFLSVFDDSCLCFYYSKSLTMYR